MKKMAESQLTMLYFAGSTAVFHQNSFWYHQKLVDKV